MHSPDPTATVVDQPGAIIAGRYRLVRAIGGGGYGEVWEARRVEGNQRVALKLLRPACARLPEVVRRFEDEVKASARLEHPLIVRVFDIDREPDTGRPFLVMEFVQGRPLNAWLAEPSSRRDGLRRALHLFAQLTGALAFAHARGIVHRDLKPENVLVVEHGERRPHIRLLDFGVARLDPVAEAHTSGADGASQTRLGVAVGTVPYMSPEQVSGDSSTVGPATDLYAVGVMLYEMLAGRLPFVGNPIQTMYAISTAPVPRLEPDDARLRGVPFELLFLVYELLQKRPEHRPEFAADVRQRLAAVLARLAPDGAGRPVLDSAQMPALGRVTSEVAAVLDSADLPVVDDEADRGADVAASLRVLTWRDPPLLGREALRRQLLEAVLDVNREQAPRCVLLAGAGGIGKRRLVRWLHELVHEQGYMRRVRLQRIGQLGLDHALQGALQLALRAPRFDRDSLAPRIEQSLRFTGDDLEQLCDFLLAQTGTGSGAAASREQRRQWREVANRALLRMTECPRPCPLLVWLDGATGDALEQAFAWTAGLLRLGRDQHRRILVVLPVDDEELADHDGAVSAFTMGADVVRIEVPPLEPEALRGLAQTIVPELVDASVELAVERSAGSPRRLRRILLDWVGRGALERVEGGLEVRERQPRLDDAVALQVRPFLGEGRGSRALEPLCGLALLGGGVTWSQAHRLLEGSGLDIEALLAGRLLTVGVSELSTTTPVLEFADRDVVEYLRDAARGLPSLSALQRRCFGLRVRAALQCMTRGDWVGARMQSTDAWRLLESLDHAPGALWLQAYDLVARLAALQREAGALEAHARELAQRAAHHADARMPIMATAELWLGWAAVLRDDAATARTHLLSAHAFALIADAPALMGRAQLRLGLVALDLERDPRAAGEAFDQARDRLEGALSGVGDDEVDAWLLGVVLADTFVYRAEAFAAHRRFAAAQLSAQRALEYLESLGDRQGMVRTYLLMARLLRQEVELSGRRPSQAPRIMAHLQRARALLATLEDRRARALMAWETASLAVAEGRHERAEGLFDEAACSFAMIGDRRSAGHCRAVCAATARAMGRLDAAAAHLDEAARSFAAEGFERGLGLVATQRGWLHLAHGDLLAAEEAFERAEEQLARALPAERVAALVGRALVLVRDGDPDAACEPLYAAALIVRTERERGEPPALDRDALGAIGRLDHESLEHPALRAIVASLQTQLAG